MRMPAFLLPSLSPWLRYPLLAPPIGATVFALYLGALGVHEVLAGGKESAAGWLLQYLWFGWPMFLLFGYVHGTLPALLTGGVAAVLGQRTRGWPVAAALAAVCASASFGASCLFGHGTDTALRFAACGALAAAVCSATGRAAPSA
jgi:hypothetical protein